MVVIRGREYKIVSLIAFTIITLGVIRYDTHAKSENITFTDHYTRYYDGWLPSRSSLELLSYKVPEDEVKIGPFFHRQTNDRPSSYPFFTGDTARSFCDHIFDETVEKSIWPQLSKNVQKGQIVFVKTDLLGVFFDSAFPNIKEPFTLVSHNADHSSPGDYSRFLDEPRIMTWFGQNPDIFHPKLVPIPIGPANAHWPHGDVSLIEKVLRKNRPFLNESLKSFSEYWRMRKNLVYVNFDIGTRFSDRKRAHDYFSSFSGSKIVTGRLTQEQYFEDLTNSRFIVSPRGNGLDCHRTWEALIMGCIPIVLHSYMDPLYKDLPVLVVNDWQEITESRLRDFNPGPTGPPSPKLLAKYWFRKFRGIQ